MEKFQECKSGDGGVLPTAGDEAHFSIEIGENGKLQVGF